MQKKNTFIIYTFIFTMVLFMMIFLVFKTDKKTDAKIKQYINDLGWYIEENAEISYIKIPSEFNETFSIYNSIQMKDDNDLSRFSGKTVKMFTYPVINHSASESNSVYISVLLYKDEIIGSVIYSNSKESFIYKTTNNSEQIAK